MSPASSRRNSSEDRGFGFGGGESDDERISSDALRVITEDDMNLGNRYWFPMLS